MNQLNFEKQHQLQFTPFSSTRHYAIGPPGHGLSAKFVFAAEQYCAN